MSGKKYFLSFFDFLLDFLLSSSASIEPNADFSFIAHNFVSDGLLNIVLQLLMSLQILVCRLLMQPDHSLHCQFSRQEMLPPPLLPLPPPSVAEDSEPIGFS